MCPNDLLLEGKEIQPACILIIMNNEAGEVEILTVAW